jgi:CHAT domain-containing protein/Tfp pilus assembly protein PilF
VVVESVQLESTGAKAGLQPGDVILSWSSGASNGGIIRSPYDLLPLEIEESPRRAVTLRGRRGDREMSWVLRHADWEIRTRPGLPSGLAALYFEGKAKAEAGDFAAAGRSWRSASESARTAGDGRLAAWFLDRSAKVLGEARMWAEVDAAYEEALAILEREPDRTAASQLLRDWGSAWQVRGAWDAAVERHQKALALDRATAPKSLAAARTLDALASTWTSKGDYVAAEELLRQALALREELAPGTTEIALSFNRLGIVARRRGDLSTAEEYLTRGEELQRRLDPGSTRHALFFMNLGNVAANRGDLQRAESLHRQSLALLEKIDPESGLIAGCLQNLVNVAIPRGDLATADELLHRILAIQENKRPDNFETWRVLVSLGHLASYRRDLEAAKAHYSRALALSEKLSSSGREVALSLSSLGEVARQESDFAAARTWLRRAQEIEERLAPGSLEVAEGLTGLARLEADSGGDLALAEGLLRQALGIYEEKAPESYEASLTLRHLGEVALRRGNPQEALALLRRTLDLQSQLSPGSTDLAETLYWIGQAERRAGRAREGIHEICRAVDVLDRQRARLGGSPEAKTSFEATLGIYYQACLEGLIDLGRSAEAFHVLERGRARSFLALLAERDLRLSDLPPELASERRHVNAEYDRVQAQLAALSAGRDSAEIERLTGELRDLRARQEEIVARIRRESPRASSLQDPEPLDLAGARAALDPGTVLLEYSVGEERTWLFAVQPAGASGAGLSVFPIDIGAKDLRREVERFRLLLKDPGSDPEEIQARARRLHDLLVRPAEARIAGAQRILLSPDGPLHTLAFAALRRGDRYLVEWKPIHSVLSATVYAGLAKSRRPRRAPGEELLTAFGDPAYRPRTPDSAGSPEGRREGRLGVDLRPLPSSRREVQSIAALYPQARVYLGREATEERAKAIGPESSLVHFACHGLLDDRFPLNSALALAPPEPAAGGQDNGFLQAWEVFESVRLDADLVTLSACDTALGREMAGEGLVGLARAFQYAGARSVLATLWGVSDLSTTRFMERFYGHLRSGKAKDEALRAAQIDQIRGQAGASHPFHWAAFQLTGDWR